MATARDPEGAGRRTSVRRRRVDPRRREELTEQVSDLVLANGFSCLTMDDLSRQINCSKATLYGVASSKEQLVIRVTKRFFARAAGEIEAAASAESDPRQRIATYLTGVGVAMRRQSAAFYADMVAYRPTADIYEHNSSTAARRLQELIESGAQQGVIRDVNGAFAAQLIRLAIDGIQSGALLQATGLSAGDVFVELGDLLLNGLSSSNTSAERTPEAPRRRGT